jgi:hypothetical protein
VACALALASGCARPPAARAPVDDDDTSALEDETVEDDRGFWVEQPNAGEIGADHPPPQTVLVIELDASLGREARVELRLDGQMLWNGAYAGPVNVGLPAGEHHLALAVVSRGGTGRGEATFESSPGCRVRVAASAVSGGIRLGRRDGCGASATR